MRLADKSIIFIICLVLDLLFFDNTYNVVIMCIALIFTCIYYLFENKIIQVCIILLFVILSFLFKEFLAFIPLMLYDTIFLRNIRYLNLLVLIPSIKHFQMVDNFYLYLVLLSIMSIVSRYKTDRLYKRKEEYIKLRDDSVEYSNLLKEKNRQLILNQDYELNMAALNERNRISKELHDSIGHILSRSLIQVGALRTITKDENLKKGLSTLHDSLSEGMDSVRETVHNMRDSSFDLKIKTEELINSFVFCKIHLDYNIRLQPVINIKYSFISILKEFLSNIIKHSDATDVYVSLSEHPGLYQLVIRDNGHISYETKVKIDECLKSGNNMENMGISGMVERVNKLKGRINIIVDKGITIFIAIPKNNE
jgi:signal transduction histidine kinase